MVSRFAGKRGGVFNWPVWKGEAFRIPLAPRFESGHGHTDKVFSYITEWISYLYSNNPAHL